MKVVSDRRTNRQDPMAAFRQGDLPGDRVETDRHDPLTRGQPASRSLRQGSRPHWGVEGHGPYGGSSSHQPIAAEYRYLQLISSVSGSFTQKLLNGFSIKLV